MTLVYWAFRNIYFYFYVFNVRFTPENRKLLDSKSILHWGLVYWILFHFSAFHWM